MENPYFRIVREGLSRLALGLTMLAMPAAAGDKVITHTVHFAKGISGATVSGAVQGYDSVLYRVGAKKGQRMQVILESKRALFNLYAPGKSLGDEAIFVGDDRNFDGVLPADGIYTVAVYLMRNEARRGSRAPYTLTIEVE